MHCRTDQHKESSMLSRALFVLFPPNVLVARSTTAKYKAVHRNDVVWMRREPLICASVVKARRRTNLVDDLEENDQRWWMMIREAQIAHLPRSARAAAATYRVSELGVVVFPLTQIEYSVAIAMRVLEHFRDL